MNTNNMTPMKRTRTPRLSDALMKGLLIWGPAYAAAASLAAYGLSGAGTLFSTIFHEALLLFLPWGLLAGAARWMLMRSRSAKSRRSGSSGTRRSTGGSRARSLRPKHA